MAELTSERLARLQSRVDVMRRERWQTLQIETEELDSLLALAREHDALRKRLEAIHAKLKEIVCTESPDDGVVLLSDDSPCHPDPETGISTYDHEHFSPLGDALIELHKMLTAALETKGG